VESIGTISPAIAITIAQASIGLDKRQASPILSQPASASSRPLFLRREFRVKLDLLRSVAKLRDITVMRTTFTRPSPPLIDYPDDDGQPMAENTDQFKWIVLIKEGLETLFHHDANVFVAGDLLWYPVEGQPKIRQAPDTMVVFRRPKGRRGSYKQWEEGGIAPQVVFEVLSPGNRPDEMARKFEFYEKHGVEEYYIYDPDTGGLRGWIRGDDGLEEVSEMPGHVSPRLGIRFQPGEGPNNLVILCPDGEPFATHQQLTDRAKAERQQADAERQRAETEREQADAERQRAETERQRAETERQRAETERQRADRLSAMLRELGIEAE
jgi:Uma2 family endonuclease